jgi:hypothetical protein
MTSPLLALFARSLREDTRLKLTYFARSGLVTVILIFMLMVDSSGGMGSGQGLGFFGTVIYVDLVFILLAGCGYFASAITEEKEEMTLGLLRMTNLNPLSILLGKSTSRLCGALLLLVAQLPFTMLAVTLGGISLGQIAAAYCTLGAFLIFLANLALLASVLCKRSAGAAALTVTALLLFFAVVPLLNWIAHLPARFGLIADDAAWVVALAQVAEFAWKASPFTRISEVLATGFNDRAFGWQAASNLALGAGCFLLAWLGFDRFCEERPESGPRRAGASRRRRFLRAGRVWRRALAWKDFYFLTGGKVWVLGKFLIYGLPLVLMACWPERLGGPPRLEAFGGITMLIAWWVLTFELAFIAASIFKTERQGQTLSTLAVLPMSLCRIAWQKITGTLPALIPAASYFVVGCVCASESILEALRHFPAEKEGFAILTGLAYGVGQSVLFLYMTANLSLRLKRGALPLAIGIQFLVQMILPAMFMAVGSAEGGLVLLVFATVVAIGFLHHNTFRRLEALAAEE